MLCKKGHVSKEFKATELIFNKEIEFLQSTGDRNPADYDTSSQEKGQPAVTSEHACDGLLQNESVCGASCSNLLSVVQEKTFYFCKSSHYMRWCTKNYSKGQKPKNVHRKISPTTKGATA